MINLNIPKEPVDIKNFIRSVRRNIEGSGESGDWIDSTSVWYGNRLSRYLWRAWRNELVNHGYSWQKFLRVLRLHTQDMVLWAIYDKLSWSDLVSRIIDSVNRYAMV